MCGWVGTVHPVLLECTQQQKQNSWSVPNNISRTVGLYPTTKAEQLECTQQHKQNSWSVPNNISRTVGVYPTT